MLLSRSVMVFYWLLHVLSSFNSGERHLNDIHKTLLLLFVEWNQHMWAWIVSVCAEFVKTGVKRLRPIKSKRKSFLYLTRQIGRITATGEIRLLYLPNTHSHTMSVKAIDLLPSFFFLFSICSYASSSINQMIVSFISPKKNGKNGFISWRVKI